MSQAPVTEIDERKPVPTVPSQKPWKTLSIAFDGVHTESVVISKSEFSIVGLNFPVLLTGAVTFKVAMKALPLNEFQPLQDVSIDGTLGAKGTTEFAEYPFFIVVPAVVEAKIIHVVLKNT